jgi:hypothetical protein
MKLFLVLSFINCDFYACLLAVRRASAQQAALSYLVENSRQHLCRIAFGVDRRTCRTNFFVAPPWTHAWARRLGLDTKTRAAPPPGLDARRTHGRGASARRTGMTTWTPGRLEAWDAPRPGGQIAQRRCFSSLFAGKRCFSIK